MRFIAHQNANSSVITVTTTATALYSLINTAGSVSNSQTYFTSPSLNQVGVANAVVITPEDGSIRLGYGITPTSTKGTLLKSGVKYILTGYDIEDIKLIRVSGDVSCSVDLVVSEKGESTNLGVETVSVTADTEFPAAAAITDNFANPTTTSVMGMNMVWDGATWDRVLGDSTNGMLVNLGTNNDVTVSTITSLTQMNGQAISMGTGVRDAGTQRVTVATDDSVPVTAAALPLPTGASTSALQGGGLPAALGAGGGLKIDGSGTALPVNGTVAVTNTDLANIAKSVNGAGAPTVTAVGSVNLSAVTGANQVVLAAQGASTQIWVTGYSFTCDTAATTVAFQDEDDTALATYGEGFAQYGGIQAPLSGNFAQPYFKVATNKALEVDVATGSIGGIVNYCVVSV